jgi:hypothetical protein
MDEARTYVVRYEYDGRARAWSAVTDTPGLATFGRTLAQTQAFAREAVATWLGLPDDRALEDAGVRVVDQVVVPGLADDELAMLAQKRHQADALRQDVAAGTASAATLMARQGYSTRDIGTALGITAARVSQVTKGRTSGG